MDAYPHHGTPMYYCLQSLPPTDAISYGIGLPVSSNLTAPLSAWSLPGEKISIIGQSYFFPYALNAMAVTATALGITNKHVLLGTALDQVTNAVRLNLQYPHSHHLLYSCSCHSLSLHGGCLQGSAL